MMHLLFNGIYCTDSVWLLLLSFFELLKLDVFLQGHEFQIRWTNRFAVNCWNKLDRVAKWILLNWSLIFVLINRLHLIYNFLFQCFRDTRVQWFEPLSYLIKPFWLFRHIFSNMLKSKFADSFFLTLIGKNWSVKTVVLISRTCC